MLADKHEFQPQASSWANIHDARGCVIEAILHLEANINMGKALQI